MLYNSVIYYLHVLDEIFIYRSFYIVVICCCFLVFFCSVCFRSSQSRECACFSYEWHKIYECN